MSDSSSQTNDTQQLVRKADLSHHITMGSLIASFVLFGLWFMVIQPPTKASPLLIALFHIIPLACFLPWVIKRRPRSYIWLCFIVLLYFCEGVLNAFYLPTGHVLGWLGLAETVIVTVLFTASMYAARWNNQVQHLGLR